MEHMGSIKQTSSGLKISDFEDKTLLIVDDDDSFRGRLSRAMEKKGFEVKDAKTVVDAIKLAGSYRQILPLSILDWRMEADRMWFRRLIKPEKIVG